MGVFVMVLVGYRNNDNKLKVWENVDWMVCHSDRKHVHQRLLLPAVHQVSVSEQKGINDYKP